MTRTTHNKISRCLHLYCIHRTTRPQLSSYCEAFVHGCSFHQTISIHMTETRYPWVVATRSRGSRPSSGRFLHNHQNIEAAKYTCASPVTGKTVPGLRHATCGQHHKLPQLRVSIENTWTALYQLCPASLGPHNRTKTKNTIQGINPQMIQPVHFY